MSYIAFTDALEAIQEMFPGEAQPEQTLKSWGWAIRVEVWDFQIEVESLNQNVCVKLKQYVEVPRKKGKSLLTQAAHNGINSLGELKVALDDVRATLLGVAIALNKVLGIE